MYFLCVASAAHFLIYGGIYMKCTNNMCIYNDENNTCILDEIEINSLAMCDSYIMITVERGERNQKRREFLKFYDELDED